MLSFVTLSEVKLQTTQLKSIKVNNFSPTLDLQSEYFFEKKFFKKFLFLKKFMI